MKSIADMLVWAVTCLACLSNSDKCSADVKNAQDTMDSLLAALSPEEQSELVAALERFQAQQMPASITDALLISIAHISSLGDAEPLDEEINGLELIAAIIRKSPAAELNELAAAAERALMSEQSNAQPHKRFVEDYSRWMELRLGYGWEGNLRLSERQVAIGECLEDEIRDWFAHRGYEMNWQKEDFDCLSDVPLELKMLPAFDALEYNIGNGGWSQLLWNCFGTWRRLLAICEGGYLLIQAFENVKALKPLRERLETHESECREFMHRADVENDFSHFARFTARSYAVAGDEWQQCFYFSSGIVERRRNWMEQNADRLRSLMTG